MAEHQTRHIQPRGKGDVMAYSVPTGKWRKVNCKYVVGNAEVYPRWKPMPNFRWTKQPVSAGAKHDG